MKLHLPTSLRKAVLSCLAALASFLPSTLASGAALSAGVVSFLVSSSLSQAAFSAPDIEWGDEGWVDANSARNLEADTNYNYRIGGDNNTSGFLISGGSETTNLRINKTGPGYKATLARSNDAADFTLNVANLWLTSEVTSGGVNYFDVGKANYLSSSIQNIYISSVGLRLAEGHTFTNTNFILAGSNYASGMGEGAPAETTLYIGTNKTVSTGGYLRVEENSTIVLRGWWSKFYVHHLEGDADLTLATGTNTADLDTDYGYFLASASTFGGRLLFEGNNNVCSRLHLSGDLTLSGLAGSKGGIFTTESEDGVTLKITGSDADANTVGKIYIFSGVTLELAANAKQTATSVLDINSGGNLTLGAGSVLTATDAALNLGGGQLTMGNGSELVLNSGTLDVTGGLSINGTAKWTVELTETTLKLGDNLTVENIGKLTLDLKGVTAASAVNVFDLEGVTDIDSIWTELQSKLIEMSSDLFVFEKTDAYITVRVRDDLGDFVWDNGDGTWGNNVEGEWGQQWKNGLSATFGADGAGEGTITVANDGVRADEVTVASGSWVFEGAGSIVAGSMSLETGSSVTISTTSGKNLGTVTLAEDSTFTITDATGWSGTNISGSGTLVLDLNTTVAGADLDSFIKGILNGGSLSKIQLNAGTDIYLSQDNLQAALQGVSDIWVESGARIGVNSPTMNVQTGTPLTLHLKGNGFAGDTDNGALYAANGNRTITWGVVLEGNATVGGSARAELAGYFDAKGYTLTKVGTGVLTFRDASPPSAAPTYHFSATGTSGHIDVQNGALELQFTYDRDTSLAQYDIKLAEGTDLKIGGDYTILYLSGAGGLASYKNSVGTDEEEAHKIILSNTYGSAANAGNAYYTGSSTSYASVELAAGYWGLGNGVNLGGTLTITSGTVEFVGGTNGTGSIAELAGAVGELVVRSGTLTVGSGEYNGTIDVAAGSTLKVTGALTAGSTSLARGAMLYLADGASYDLSTNLSLPGSEGNAEIYLDITGSTYTTPMITLGSLDNLLITLGIDESLIAGDLITLEGLISYNGNADTLLSHLDYSALGRGWEAAWDNGTLTLTKAADAALDLTWKDGTTWSTKGGGWSKDTEGTPEDAEFETGDNVIFDTPDHSGDSAITISGGVMTGNMTVKSGSWTFEGDALTVGGEFTIKGGGTITFNNELKGMGQGMTIGEDSIAGDNTHVVITAANFGSNLGEIKVNAGSKLTLDAGVVPTLTGWTDDCFVWGEGTLAVSSATTDGAIAFANLVAPLLKAGKTLKALELGTETRNIVVQTGADASMASVFSGITDVYVMDGSCLNIQAGRVLQVSDGTGSNHTLYLSGAGSSVGTSMNSALNLTNGHNVIDWNVTLLENASICAFFSSAANTATVNGLFDFDDNTLTLVGRGVLILTQVANVGDVVLSHEYGSQIQYTKGTAGSQIAKRVNFETSGSKLLLETSDTDDLRYTVESVYGVGEVRCSTSTGSATLVISNTDSAKADNNSFSGTLVTGVTAEVAGGYWNFSGTQQGVLAVKGGTLELSTTADSASYTVDSVAGGTLKVSENVSANVRGLSGGSLYVAGSASLGTVASGSSLTTLTLAGGSLNITGGSLSIGTLEIGATPGALSIGLTGSTKLSVNSLGSTLTGGSEKITIQVAYAEAMAWLESGYELFEGGILSTGTGWGAANFDVEITDDERGLMSASVDDEGRIIFVLDAQDLRWVTAGGGVWEVAGDESWLDEETSAPSSFTTSSTVTFDNEQGGTMQLKGDLVATKLTVESGDWVFEDAEGETETPSLSITGGIEVKAEGSAEFRGSALSVSTSVLGQVTFAGESTTLVGEISLGSNRSGSAEVEFTGDGAVGRGESDTAGIALKGNSSLTISNTGSKHFGDISVAAGSTVTIANASGWSNSKVTGDGTLVYQGITVGVTGANTEWNDFANMVKNTLDGTGTTSTATTHLGKLVLRDTNVLMSGETNTNDIQPYFSSAKELYIEDGSSVGFDGAVFNRDPEGPGVRTLFIEGSGANGEGALYLTGTFARLVNWNVTLTGHASVSSNQANPDGVRMQLQKAYNGGGFTLSKIGNGVLRLGESFSTVDGSSGTFEVRQGALTMNFTENRDTALANYDFFLNGGELGLIGNFTIQHLYGASADSVVESYKQLGPHRDGVDTENAHTLTIANTDTDARDTNTYAGAVSGKMAIALTSGYEKLTGTYKDGAAFSVGGGDAAATLELTGTFEGAHTLNVSENGTLKLTGSSHTGALSVYAAGSSTIEGLTLMSGDKLSIADNATSDTYAGDAAVNLSLTGTTTLYGGSTISFGVQYVDNTSSAGWSTTTNLTNNGTLSFGDAGEVVVEIDPYGRMANGDVHTLAMGTHTLISNVSEDMVAHFTTANPSEGRLRYVLRYDEASSSLVLDVLSGANTLHWGGGSHDWSAENVWTMASGEPDTFVEGDIVYFDAPGDAVMTVNAAGQDIKVGAIVVKGSASYTLEGNIGGVNGDEGLTVGSADGPYVSYTGTLVLTGENSWNGDNFINAGTVEVRHAKSLSTGATTLGWAAELQLNLNGDTLASAVSMKSASIVSALTSGTVKVTELEELSTLEAATGTVLTVETPEVLGDKLAVNPAPYGEYKVTWDGEVVLRMGATTSAQELEVSSGTMSLEARDAAAELTADITKVSDGVVLQVGSGVTFNSDKITAGGATLVMEDGSAISSQGELLNVISRGALLDSPGYMDVNDTLSLEGGSTAMQGIWDVENVQSSGNAGLVVRDGSISTDVTLRAGSVENVSVESGALNVGDGLAIGHLSMTGGALGGADDNAAGVTAEVVSISGDSVVKKEVSLELSGSGSEISGGSVAANIAVNNASADGSAALTISGGAVSGEVDILSGLVVIASGAQVSGTVTLHGDSTTLDLSGAATHASIRMLGGGTLKRAASHTGNVLIDDLGTTPGIIFDLGGLSGSATLTIVSLTGGNSVTNLDGLRLTGSSSIYLNDTLQVGSSESVTPLFQFSGSGSLTLEDGASLFVDVSSILGDVLAAGDGGLSYQVANVSIGDWDGKFTYDATAVVLGWEIQYYDGGVMHFSAHAEALDRNIYVSSDEQGGSSNWAQSNDDSDIYESVGNWGAIVVNKQTNIDLSGQDPKGQYKDTGLLLRNLMGTEEGVLHIQGDGSKKVTLRNDVSASELDSLRDQLGGDLVQNGLTYAGSISIDNADMEVYHVDGLYSSKLSIDSTTTVRGSLRLTNGNLTMTSGRLALVGSDNELGRDVSFHEYQGQVSVSGQVVVGGSISVLEDAAAVGEERAHVQLVNGGELKLAHGSSVGERVIIGSNVADAASPQVSGTVSVDSASISSKSKLRHVVLAVNGDLSIDTSTSGVAPFAARAVVADDAEWYLAGLTGKGVISTTAAKDDAASTGKDIAFLVAGEHRYFTGDLVDYSGTMTFLKGEKDYAQHFVAVAGGSEWNVTNTEGGRVVFNMAEGGGSNRLTMGDLNLESGSYTTILMDLERMNSNSGLHLQGLNMAKDADVTIGQYKGTVWLEGEDGEEHSYVLGKIDVAEGGDRYIDEDVQWHLKGIRNAHNVKVSVDNDGNVTATVVQDNTNLYARYANNANSAAGAQMLWGNNPEGDLADLDSTVYELLSAEAPTAGDVAEANRIMAAAAGSSVAVLGRAFAADIERQLRTVRNRTTTMAPDSYSDGEGFKANTWLNAENNYYKQDADGMMPGFKTTGWGGTVGLDAAAGKNTVVGLALSAMYNDVESDGPDRLKGNMDTFYVSAFAQMTESSWRHTFVCTFGRADIDVDRTVNYGAGSYTTNGSTDSMGLGLMYELGYSFALGADSATCVQTVFNAAWKMSRLSGYTESGSDAALHVGDQNYNAVTLGLGARVQTAVGSQAWNRIGILEARALVKTELGDRQGEASVAFQRAGATAATVKSSEKGSVGIELGAGLTLPVTVVSDVFVDFSVELWKNQMEMNAGIGYKVSF